MSGKTWRAPALQETGDTREPLPACSLCPARACREGGSCCLGVFQPHQRHSKMHGKALQAWPYSGVQHGKIMLGHS